MTNIISKYNSLKIKLNAVINKYNDGKHTIRIVNKNFNKKTNQQKN